MIALILCRFVGCILILMIHHLLINLLWLEHTLGITKDIHIYRCRKLCIKCILIMKLLCGLWLYYWKGFAFQKSIDYHIINSVRLRALKSKHDLDESNIDIRTCYFTQPFYLNRMRMLINFLKVNNIEKVVSLL